MKLYFETKNLGEDCITPCPFEDPDCMVGSVECVVSSIQILYL